MFLQHVAPAGTGYCKTCQYARTWALRIPTFRDRLPSLGITVSFSFINFIGLSHSDVTVSDPPVEEASRSSSSYIVVLPGTYVDGKETIAISLSKLLDCRWLEGDQVHSSSNSIARSQEKRGYDNSMVYGRTWFTKM